MGQNLACDNNRALSGVSCDAAAKPELIGSPAVFCRIRGSVAHLDTLLVVDTVLAVVSRSIVVRGLGIGSTRIIAIARIADRTGCQ